jgi:hypothetical protein
MIDEKEKQFQEFLLDVPRRAIERGFRLAALLNPEEWIEIVLARKAPGQKQVNGNKK